MTFISISQTTTSSSWSAPPCWCFHSQKPPTTCSQWTTTAMNPCYHPRSQVSAHHTPFLIPMSHSILASQRRIPLPTKRVSFLHPVARLHPRHHHRHHHHPLLPLHRHPNPRNKMQCKPSTLIPKNLHMAPAPSVPQLALHEPSHPCHYPPSPRSILPTTSPIINTIVAPIILMEMVTTTHLPSPSWWCLVVLCTEALLMFLISLLLGDTPCPGTLLLLREMWHHHPIPHPCQPPPWRQGCIFPLATSPPPCQVVSLVRSPP